MRYEQTDQILKDLYEQKERDLTEEREKNGWHNPAIEEIVRNCSIDVLSHFEGLRNLENIHPN